jgi:hypothetical protein
MTVTVADNILSISVLVLECFVNWEALVETEKQ